LRLPLRETCVAALKRLEKLPFLAEEEPMEVAAVEGVCEPTLVPIRALVASVEVDGVVVEGWKLSRERKGLPPQCVAALTVAAVDCVTGLFCC
jgi:hypothetical protein